jgi:hypothetical protein
MKGVHDRVLAKLHTPEKVELQSEKVELGNSGKEFEKAFRDADKEAIKMLDFLESAEATLSKAEAAAKIAEKGYTEASSKMIKVERLFKEIGVPVTSRFEQMFSEMKKNWVDVSKRVSSIEKSKNLIK